MSFTINGIGTHVYGRDNLLIRSDQCDQCGQFSQLQSYDATNYFVVIFLPIIPLGKLRILDHCRLCQRWRQMPLKEWKSAKDDAIRGALEKMKANPSDAEAMKEALVVATQFHDPHILSQFKEVAANFKDAEVQALLGATMSFFGRTDEAIKAFSSSLQVKDDPDVKEDLAVEFAMSNQPEQAEPLLEHIWTQEHKSKIGHAIAVAQAYQSKGDHRNAIKLFDKIATLHPEVTQDREFQKMTKKSRSHRSGPAPALVQPTRFQESSSESGIAKWILPAILVIGLLGFLGASWMAGLRRQVVLVNGLREPYVATVAGVAHELPPGRIELVKVSEGDVTVKATINGQTLPAETHAVKTPFLTRLFGIQPTFIFNPDGVAVISREQVIYSNRRDVSDPMMDFLVGATFYEEKQIDYPFTQPPSQIETEDTSRSITKLRLDLMSQRDYPSEVAYLADLRLVLEEDQLINNLRRRVEIGERDEAVMATLSSLLGPQKTVEVFKERLDDRPINVGLHRIYQDSLEVVDPDADILADYWSKLGADSTNAELIYLVARVTEDLDEQAALLRKAARSSPPSAYAHNALAFGHLTNAEFQLGLASSQEAVKLSPDSVNFKMVLTGLQQALGNHKQALEFIEDNSSISNPISRMQRLIQIIPLLVADGKADEARDEISTYRQYLLDNSSSLEEQQQMTMYFLTPLRMLLAYAENENNSLIRLSNQLEEKPLYVLIALGYLDEATKLFDEEHPELKDDAIANLTMYVAAKSSKRADLATKHLANAITLLKAADSTSEEKSIAAALEGEGPNPSKIGKLHIWPNEKRVYLAALALKHPKYFNAYMDLARKLNYHRISPYHLINQLRSP